VKDDGAATPYLDMAAPYVGSLAFSCVSRSTTALRMIFELQHILIFYPFFLILFDG